MTTIDAEPVRASRTKPATAYDDAFFDQIDRDGLASARVIVPLVQKLVDCDSVVDVGCGRGAWLRVFLEHGASRVVGYDGAYVDQSQLLIPRSSFRAADLSKPINVTERFDLAVCLEVAEHLPRAAAGNLVQTLTTAAPAVLFSAALPGQGGANHINEQWPLFWQTLFAKYHYRRLDPIRWSVWRNPSVASWYKQNVYLFVSYTALQGSPSLQEELASSEASQFELIHQDVLSPYNSFRGLIRALPRAAWNAVSRLF